MSSLKGQLSNVEGSVKSMKVAVVVGSVLTVACLAAVFGVTVLANEVSKEVKVSNGSLTSKSGETVKTSTMEMSNKVTLNSETLFGENASFKINAVVVQESTLLSSATTTLSSRRTVSPSAVVHLRAPSWPLSSATTLRRETSTTLSSLACTLLLDTTAP